MEIFIIMSIMEVIKEIEIKEIIKIIEIIAGHFAAAISSGLIIENIDVLLY